MTWPPSWTLGALTCILSSDDGGICTYCMCTQLNGFLNMFGFFVLFFSFPYAFFYSLNNTKPDIQYTKGDAMMLYSHNAHQNTSPIR